VIEKERKVERTDGTHDTTDARDRWVAERQNGRLLLHS
jgi:hypothetical protein